MIYLIPHCFEDFSCIADRCPDTCCSGWEVDLDEEALAKYNRLPGPLGQEIRSKIQTGDGYTFFRMEQGRCPFLNSENLCRLILEAGEGCLSTTCREHPRFWEEYGDRQETCLAISCPEAARLLLGEPFRLQLRETEVRTTQEPDFDPELLDQLLALRDDLFALALGPNTLSQRIRDILALFGAKSPLPVPAFLQAMTQMEFTDHRLQDRLITTLNRLPRQEDVALLLDRHSMEGENLLCYFLYRYVLRALWDGLVYEKIAFCLCSLLSIFTIAAAQEGAFDDALLWSAILYSREVEHSPDNLELLYGTASADA